MKSYNTPMRGFSLISLLITIAIIGLLFVWLYGSEEQQNAIEANRDANEQLRTEAQLEAEAVVDILNNQ